jgi:hypothetical protein
VFIDSPIVQTLHFDATGGIQVYTTYDGPPSRPEYITVGSFTNHTAMHVEMDFDTPAETWLIKTNGTTVYDDVMYGSSFDSVRFAATGAAAFVDNVLISTVPIPAAVWLFGSTLAGLGWLR